MNLLQEMYNAEAPETSVTEWLKGLAEWSGLSLSGLWKWWNGERTMNPAARKLLRLRQHLTAEQLAMVKEL